MTLDDLLDFVGTVHVVQKVEHVRASGTDRTTPNVVCENERARCQKLPVVRLVTDPGDLYAELRQHVVEAAVDVAGRVERFGCSPKNNVVPREFHAVRAAMSALKVGRSNPWRPFPSERICSRLRMQYASSLYAS